MKFGMREFLGDSKTHAVQLGVVDGNGHVVKQQVVHAETTIGQESFVQGHVYDLVTYCNTFDPAWRQRFDDLCRLHCAPVVANKYDAT